jgi:hypothetical protein
VITRIIIIIITCHQPRDTGKRTCLLHTAISRQIIVIHKEHEKTSQPKERTTAIKLIAYVEYKTEVIPVMIGVNTTTQSYSEHI